MLDTIVGLTWIAAHTERERIASGIIVLPQRNPLLLAKELASVDVVSRGMPIVGVGAGATISNQMPPRSVKIFW